MAQAINMLVVGECGDGKSTLINGLRDPCKSTEPLCGKDPQGVTKEIMLYRCPDLNGKPFNLIDTPGVGDGTVTPKALLALLDEFLKSGKVPGGIRGVIATTPISDCRLKLGAQVVQIIVDKGFVAGANGDKYANIILAGTKADKADEGEKANFMKGTGGKKSVCELFFQLATPPGNGPAVMVSKQDYTPLLKAIMALPVVSIIYQSPEAKVMASALAEKLGVEAAGVKCQLAQQGKQIEGLKQQMHEADLERRKEMQQQEEQKAELRREMLLEQRKKAEEEQRREQEREQKRRQEAERARQERQQEQKRREDAERQQQEWNAQRLRELQEQAAADQRRREQERRQAQALAAQAQQQARDAQANRGGGGGGGGDCFPGSATVETPHGPKPMTALRAGDEVLAVSASGELFFDEVYFFGHAAPEELGPYVWLRTASGKALRASPRHFVPVVSKAKNGPAGQGGWEQASYHYAGTVQVGDELWVHGPTGLAREAVLEVASGTGEGVFNPFTFSGTLVVDGVVASVHSDWLLDDIVPTSWLPSLHGIYQALLLPGRGLYRLLGAAAADVLEVNNPQGERCAAIGTSRRAFAFFVASHLLPAAALTAAAAQRLAQG